MRDSSDGRRHVDDDASHAEHRGARRPLAPRDALARATAQAYKINELSGFRVHRDADVLDPAVLPTVDSPGPHGLLPDELTALLRPLLASPHCAGCNVTIYDPDLDPKGTAGALLADVVVAACAPS